MATYREIIASAGTLVAHCKLADLLLPLWRRVEWVAQPEASGGDAAISAEEGNTIQLHPALLASPKAGELVLRAFGSLLLRRAGDDGQAVWRKKLDVPTAEAIDLAISKLSNPDLRRQCHSYAEMLDRYPQRGHSVERLVYINMVNALLANNLSYADSGNADLRNWGPCAEYCALKKYHSLIPLVSAYAPADIFNDYGAALAALVVDDLSQVRDKSVACALRGIVQRVAKLAVSV